MPRLSSLGDALTGVGSGINAINGSVPPSLAAALGAGWDWLDDLDAIGPTNLGLGAGLNVYSLVVSTDTLALVSAGGPNNIQAGGGVWVQWGAGGITTNVVAVPSLPAAGPGAVDFDGTWAVCTVYQTGSGITVYSSTGTVLQQINVSLLGTIKMRSGWLTYHTTQGWPIVDAITGSPLPGYVQQANVTGLIPVGTDPSVVEYNATTAQWSVRLATAGTGLLLPISGQMFGVDAIQLDADTIRMAWSTGAGELPGELVILDIDTDTGTTQIGTVVGGSIVFTVGPTLEGTRFSMATSPSGYPPLTQTVLRVDKSGLMSDPWAAYLRNLSFGATNSARAISNTSPPTPPSTFQAPVFVSDIGLSSGFPQARQAEDSVTIEWDFTVPGVVKANVIAGISTLGYWSILTNGDPVTPEVIFADGDCVSVWVPTP